MGRKTRIPRPHHRLSHARRISLSLVLVMFVLQGCGQRAINAPAACADGGFDVRRLEVLHATTKRFVDERKHAGIITLLARDGKVSFRSIKLCFCGAAALMAETQRRFEELTGGVIVEGYSLTEAQMAVVANPVRGEKKVGSVGMPLPDVGVRIVDADEGRTPMPLGDVGEIVVSAPQLMLGYWQRPEETKEMLRAKDRGERLL